MISLILTLLLLLPYALWLIISIRSLRHATSHPSPPPPSHEPITIIVCTHHEPLTQLSLTISSLLQALSPSDHLIIVTDHTSPTLTAQLTSSFPRAKVIANPNPQGKKHAQRAAVLLATTRVIASVDADCQVNPHFLHAIRQSLHPTPDFMLLLPVAMQGHTLLTRMIDMEFTCLQAVTAGTALAHHPTMANGAGMVFTHDLFLAHDPNTRIASGDDMFLLAHAIHSHIPISFATHPDALVTTQAPNTLSAYLRQRTRWLAKASAYSPNHGSRDVLLLAISVLLAVMACPIATLLALLSLTPWLTPLIIFLLKLSLDIASFLAMRPLTRSQVHPIYALPLEFLYPLMVLTVALRSLFANRRNW